MDKWVICELSQKAEGEDPDIVRKSISYTVRGAEVFIPAAITTVGEDRVVHYLVEGYAFIRHKHEQGAYNRLENSRYVAAVLTTVSRPPGGRPVRQLAFVNDSDIERMKRQIHRETDQGIGVGDTVLITSGAYRQITAKIIEEIPEHDKVQVHIQLRSKDAIITLPRSFLRLVTKAPRPEFIDRFEETKEWFNDAKETLNLSAFPYDTTDIRVAQSRFMTLHTWSQELEPRSAFVRAFYTPLDPAVILAKGSKTLTLMKWSSQWQSLSPLPSMPPKARVLDAKFKEWGWLLSLQHCLDGLRASVLEIERQMNGRTDPMSFDNIVIDGFNLAFRVFYAPGMADLRDAKQRPTGVIYGFLRSLQALIKRFPGAKLTVCWDGSNQRRKALYAGYKANRTSSTMVGGDWDQVAWLREILPYLGVAQAYNPEEEADDVLATLVRGPLRGYRNLMLSSDRDLLQLVTATDNLMTPTQGKRKETVYDPATLLAEWGVEASQMVMLRALYGDSSDNIPGVPTVPEKVLISLVQLYGSLDGIYSSNLAGLTKLRHERIRSAEKQVRLNQELMTLRTVSYVDVPSTPNQTTASERLTDVDMEAELLFTAFFGESSEQH